MQYSDGALACLAALLGMYIMKRRKQQQSSKAALAKGGSGGGNDLESGNRGSAYMGDRAHAQPDQDKVAAMLASTKADAARMVSKRQSPLRENYAGKHLTLRMETLNEQLLSVTELRHFCHAPAQSTWKDIRSRNGN